MTRSSYNLFTGFPQKLWKAYATAPIILALCCMVLFAGCSKSKGVSGDQRAKPSSNSSPMDNALISKEQEDVRKRLGDPTVVSKTMEDHILWVYSPTWKIMPNDKGTLYVEFRKRKGHKDLQEAIGEAMLCEKCTREVISAVCGGCGKSVDLLGPYCYHCGSRIEPVDAEPAGSPLKAIRTSISQIDSFAATARA